MTGSPTFQCPFCGAPISGSAPGATFACPYCQAKVVAPFANVPITGQQAAYSGRPSWEPQQSTGPFASGVENVAIAFDPQLGFLAIGVHAPYGQPPCLRAWDLKNKRVLWDTLQGQTWLDAHEPHVKVLGRNVYIANKRQLLCLDLANGNRKWAGALSDAVSTDHSAATRGLQIADPFATPGRGAILVATIDHGLFSFDRDSGQPLWQRSFGDKAIDLQAVEYEGAVVVRVQGWTKVEIVNPAFPQPIARHGDDHWSTDLGIARLFGRTVVTVADDMGPESDQDGVLCFDAVTGRVHFFDQIEDLEEDDVVPAVVGQRVFCATDDLDGIYVGPYGHVMPPPIPHHHVMAFCAAGPTLAMILKKAHGTEVRRIVGIDPNTLAFRFDAGEAGTEPDDDWDRQIVSDGYTVVYVATPNDDDSQCELRSLDTSTGRLLWSKRIGRWQSHRFLGGHLVVRSDEKIEVLAPPNGQVIASLP